MPLAAFLTLFLAALLCESCSSPKAAAPPIKHIIRNAPGASKSRSLEQRALFLTNQARQRHGLSPVRRNANLDIAAKRHSSVMAKYRYIGHHEPRGTSSLMKRLDKANYNARYCSENVFGPDTSFRVIDHAILTPENAVGFWMKSPGHRRNILNPRVKDVGIGHVDGYWTQVFGESL